MNIESSTLLPGEPTRVGDLLLGAWADTPELGWNRSYAEQLAVMQASAMEHERVELHATDGCGQLVGCCVLVLDDDLHVGLCLSIMWNFIVPEHRGTLGRRFLRAAYCLARALGVATLAYTHRRGVGRYETTYRRVYGQKIKKAVGLVSG